MPRDVKHGTYGGYTNGGCRCEQCRDANRVYRMGLYYRRKHSTIKESGDVEARTSTVALSSSTCLEDQSA